MTEANPTQPNGAVSRPVEPSPAPPSPVGPAPEGLSGNRYLAYLTLTALGVVYGDIGTSPLYALRECFHGPHAMAISRGNVLGVLSLIFWSLIVVVSIKYLVFILRADNRGEGGILALTALVVPVRAARGPLPPAAHPRPLRRRAALRRRHDHAGDLGALGGRGPRRSRPRSSRRTSCRSPSPSSSSSSSSRAAAPAASARSSGRSSSSGSSSSASLGLYRHRRAAERPGGGEPAVGAALLRPRTAGTASSCSARCSSSSPAARRSTPTWGTSASGRSASAGSRWCCRRCCSTTSARARCCSPTRRRRRTPSTTWRRTGRPIRWWCWRPWPR